jgi:xylulokinase
MAKLFLGLDVSTQSLSAMVIDYDRRKIIYNASFNFDESLPHYKTRNGVLPNRNPLVKHSPPLMWVEALDLAFAQMKKRGVPLGQILAISGSGQQHGSVYLKAGAGEKFAHLDPKIPLAQNLQNPVLLRPSGWIPRLAKNARKSATNSAE